MSHPVSVFASYSSCCEEGYYCRHPAEITKILCDAQGPLFDQARSLYLDIYQQDWREEVVNPRLLKTKKLPDINQARSTQQILYLGALEWIKARFSITSGCGFSLGYSAIFMAANIITPKNWMGGLYPAIGAYLAHNHDVWLEGKTFTTLFSAGAEAEFMPVLRAMIAEIYPEAMVKDDRYPYALQIVAPERELLEIRARIFQAFPHAERKSSAMIRTDAAHFSPERYRETQGVFSRAQVAPAAFEVVTHDSEIPAGRMDEAAGSKLFMAIHGPLCMGVINRHLTNAGTPLVLIGSGRAAKFAFYSFGNALFKQPYYFWEDVLLKRWATPDFSLQQAYPTW